MKQDKETTPSPSELVQELKIEDFGKTVTAEGYQISYKGQNIGGAGITGRFKGRGRLQQIQDYSEMADRQIRCLVQRYGYPHMVQEIDRINQPSPSIPEFKIGDKVKDLSGCEGTVIENPSHNYLIRVSFGKYDWRDLKPEHLTPSIPVKEGEVLDMKLKLKKDGCHICNSWSALNGCKHYGPQDYTANKPIIDAIVAALYGSREIVETSDFYAGINAALICLKQNNLLK